MNIYKIKSKKNLLYVKSKNECILECAVTASGEYTMELYYPKKNVLVSLGGGRKLADPDRVKNAVKNREDVYYTAISSEENRKIRADIYRYSVSEGSEKIIYTYTTDETDFYSDSTRFFILSENFMLVQEDNRIKTQDGTAAGDFDKGSLKNSLTPFSLKLIKLDTCDEITVRDENLLNNGISEIIPVSKTRIMIKTGDRSVRADLKDYKTEPGKTHIEDASVEKAPIESVFINTLQKFIADLSLGRQTMDMELIYSAYFDKYIYAPKYKEDFIYFTVVSRSGGSSECVFYNIHTQERFTCKNKNVDINGKNAAYVINKTPYVRSIAGRETVFLNLRTMEFDISCMELNFLDVVGRFLLAETKDGKKVSVFRCPDMKTVMNEKGNYKLGCTNNNDCYLYF